MSKSAVLDWRASMDELKSSNKESQDQAFLSLSEMTKQPVAWAYGVWDDLLCLISEGDNRQRSIAGQLLCNLAQSDPEKRIVKDAAVLLGLTKDERFVTARHCLLSLWKVANAGPRQRNVIVDGLVRRFKECANEKNCTLVRYDIQCTLRRIDDLTPDPQLRSAAEELIQLEEDPKYKKKYATAWRGASS